MAKVKAPVNKEKRPIDKSKRSNRRCCNCAFWPGGCGMACEKSGRVIDYYNCCKQFEWNPAGVYVGEGEEGATEMEFTFGPAPLNQLILLLNSVSCTARVFSDSLVSRLPAAERRRMEKSLAAVKDLETRLAQIPMGRGKEEEYQSMTFSSKDMSIIRFSLCNDIAAVKEELIEGVEDMQHLASEKSEKYTSASFDDALDELKTLAEFYTSNAKKFSQLTELLTELNVSAQNAGLSIRRAF